MGNWGEEEPKFIHRLTLSWPLPNVQSMVCDLTLEKWHMMASFEASAVTRIWSKVLLSFCFGFSFSSIHSYLIWWCCAVSQTLIWVLSWSWSTGFWLCSYEPLCFRGWILLPICTYLLASPNGMPDRGHTRSWMDNCFHSSSEMVKGESHMFSQTLNTYLFWITEETPNQATKSWRSTI